MASVIRTTRSEYWQLDGMCETVTVEFVARCLDATTMRFTTVVDGQCPFFSLKARCSRPFYCSLALECFPLSTLALILSYSNLPDSSVLHLDAATNPPTVQNRHPIPLSTFLSHARTQKAETEGGACGLCRFPEPAVAGDIHAPSLVLCLSFTCILHAIPKLRHTTINCSLEIFIFAVSATHFFFSSALEGSQPC